MVSRQSWNLNVRRYCNPSVYSVRNATCCSRPKVRLCLAAGKIRPTEHEKIRKHCKKHNWGLFDREWFQAKFAELAESRYENEVAIVAAKLIGN